MSVWRSFFLTGKLVGMMCPADGVMLTRGLRRIKQARQMTAILMDIVVIADTIQAAICNQSATKQCIGRAVTGQFNAILKSKPQYG